MALVTRLSRLFEADFHGLLDRIEEPDLQLKQAVREMQSALDQDRQSLQLQQHELAQLERSTEEIGASITALDQELDICLDADKEDLARDLIRRKLATERHLQTHQQQAQKLETQQQQLRRQIDEQEQQLTSMKQKLELLVSADRPFVLNDVERTAAIRPEEVEIALLREKERRAQS